MKKHLSSLLVLLFILALISACGSISSNSNTNSGTQPPPGSQPGGGSPTTVQGVISECGTTVDSSGSYSLDSSLSTTSNTEPCINIANVNNVTLSCNSNSITGADEYGISVLNVSNLSIENCNVAIGTGDGSATLLSLNNVNGGRITGSTFGSNQNSGGVYISDTTNVTFGSQLPGPPLNPSVTTTTNPSIGSQIANAPAASNIIYGFLSASNNVNLVIEGNALTWGSNSLNAFMIGTFGGKNTQVINNTVNGSGNPIPIEEENGSWNYSFIATDDDILIEDETGALISGNLLVNTFNAGTETVGYMKDMIISKNYIDNVATGMGGWYYLSVSNTQFVQNVMTNIESRGFHYNRCGGLRPAGGPNLPFMFYTIPVSTPAETAVNFNQNQFVGNTLSQPIVFQGEQVASFEAAVYSSMDYTRAAQFPGTDPTPQQFITVNNTFANNNFDPAFSPLSFSVDLPWTYTSADVVDGGGNICSGSQTFVPSVSPTFGNQTGSLVQFTPISCRSGN